MGEGGEARNDWVREAARVLSEKGLLYIGFSEQPVTTAYDPLWMRSAMASLVAAVCDRLMPAELFIEGGSTAQAVIDRMGLRDAVPVDVWSRGVVRLEAHRVAVTVKPGSYPIPAQFLDIFT